MARAKPPILREDVSLIVRRGIRRGMLTVWRDRGWGASVGGLLGVAFLLHILIVTALGVQGMAYLLRTQTDLYLEALPQADERAIQEFHAAAASQPFVGSLRYITREQAYEEERARDPDLIAFLETFGIRNPFPDSFRITLRSLDDYDAFATFVKQQEWNSVVDPAFLSHVTDQETEVHDLLTLTEAFQGLLLFFFLLMGGVLLFLLIELTRRRSLARREEILVERLVGADTRTTLLPFCTECAILLTGALLISAVLLVPFLRALPVLLPALGDSGAFGPIRTEISGRLQTFFPLLLFLEILLAIPLAVIGAWFGMRSQLKTAKISLTAS